MTSRQRRRPADPPPRGRVSSAPDRSASRRPESACRFRPPSGGRDRSAGCDACLFSPQGGTWQAVESSCDPVSASGLCLDWNVYTPAIAIGATAALIGSMMANAEKSAVASVRSNSSASESPCAEYRDRIQGQALRPRTGPSLSKSIRRRAANRHQIRGAVRCLMFYRAIDGPNGHA